MHFLCLHGVGTNSKILEVQSAAVRRELGDSHTYDYAEGTLPTPILPEISPHFPDEDEGFAYFDPSRPETLTVAMDNLEAFILSEGPFDGILAFSHGAQLAATFLVERGQVQGSAGARSIQCALFFSGGIPYHSSPTSTRGLAYMTDEREGGDHVMLHLPTAHFWGQNDVSYPGTSEVLSLLCKPEWRAIYVHEGRHEIPGWKSRSCLMGSIEVVQRTVHLALGLN